MSVDGVQLRCVACGARVPDPSLFRCPAVQDGDDIDHLVIVEGLPEDAAPDLSTPNPFLRYRDRLYPGHFARSRGWSDKQYEELVIELDASVAAVDGRGFRVTPLVNAGDGLWIKDETGNVGGSHKARHLMSALLCLEIAKRTGGDTPSRPLAIASCGNAARAAAILARASDRDLEVYVPADAPPAEIDGIRELGARVHTCGRDSHVAGDPCMAAFRDAVRTGSIPFSVQGPENGLVIDGGKTLGYELADQLDDAGVRLDAIVLQVGGGALASSVTQAFRAVGMAARIHGVQTMSVPPLTRAYDRFVHELLSRSPSGSQAPADAPGRADWIRSHLSAAAIEETLQFARRHRSRFMESWTGASHSLARGILDDETYDWCAIVEGMVRTGGFPVVVSEDVIAGAHRRGHDEHGISVCPTGAAGLAGLHTTRATYPGLTWDNAAVIFTGADG